MQLDSAPFGIAGDLEDIRSTTDDTSDALNQISPASSSSISTIRMSLRLKAFSQCAQLLQANLPNSTISFALMGCRMLLPPVYDTIHQDLGSIGALKLGDVDLLTVMEELFSTAKESPPYTTPVPHPQSGHTTFAYPDPNLDLLQMGLVSIPQGIPINVMHAPEGSEILLAFDTNVHSRFSRQLVQLSALLGRNIRIVSLPAVAQEISRGYEGVKRGLSLKALISTGKVKTFEKYDLPIGPIPLMNVDGTITMIQNKGDIRIRTEAAMVTKQAVEARPGCKVTFVFGTIDTGCHFLCGAINSGVARFVLPKLGDGDGPLFVMIMLNILQPLLLSTSSVNAS